MSTDEDDDFKYAEKDGSLSQKFDRSIKELLKSQDLAAGDLKVESMHKPVETAPSQHLQMPSKKKKSPPASPNARTNAVVLQMSGAAMNINVTPSGREGPLQLNLQSAHRSTEVEMAHHSIAHSMGAPSPLLPEAAPPTMLRTERPPEAQVHSGERPVKRLPVHQELAASREASAQNQFGDRDLRNKGKILVQELSREETKAALPEKGEDITRLSMSDSKASGGGSARDLQSIKSQMPTRWKANPGESMTHF